MAGVELRAEDWDEEWEYAEDTGVFLPRRVLTWL